MGVLSEDNSEDSVGTTAGLIHVGGGHSSGIERKSHRSLSSTLTIFGSLPSQVSLPHRALFPQSMRSAMSA